MADKNERIGKSLSYWLRHKPESIGIELDEEGWTDLQTLCTNTNHKLEEILEAVKHCEKKRFDIKDGRIRAKQGHSVPLKIKYKEVSPNIPLFHGTKEQFLCQIQEYGLLPMKRHHVHLSKSKEEAKKVGDRRQGKTVVLLIDTEKMIEAGHKFYVSENEVYLTDKIPYDYIYEL